MAIEQGNMTIVAYEAKFYALYRYPTRLVTTMEEKIQLFVKDLNYELQILFFHMIVASKNFNKVTDFVNKADE